MILATIGQVITQAQAEFESKRSRRAAEEAAAAEAPAAPVAPAASPLKPLRRRRLDRRFDGSVRKNFRRPVNLQLSTKQLILYG